MLPTFESFKRRFTPMAKRLFFFSRLRLWFRWRCRWRGRSRHGDRSKQQGKSFFRQIEPGHANLANVCGGRSIEADFAVLVRPGEQCGFDARFVAGQDAAHGPKLHGRLSALQARSGLRLAIAIAAELAPKKVADAGFRKFTDPTTAASQFEVGGFAEKFLRLDNWRSGELKSPRHEHGRVKLAGVATKSQLAAWTGRAFGGITTSSTGSDRKSVV